MLHKLAVQTAHINGLSSQHEFSHLLLSSERSASVAGQMLCKQGNFERTVSFCATLIRTLERNPGAYD